MSWLLPILCCPYATTGGTAAILQQVSEALHPFRLILLWTSLCSLAPITQAAVWIMSSTYKMTVLRSDLTRSSIVQTHGKRQGSLNKLGKDWGNPHLIGREQDWNSVIHFAQTTGNTGTRIPVCYFEYQKNFHHLSSHNLKKTSLPTLGIHTWDYLDSEMHLQMLGTVWQQKAAWAYLERE